MHNISSFLGKLFTGIFEDLQLLSDLLHFYLYAFVSRLGHHMY